MKNRLFAIIALATPLAAVAADAGMKPGLYDYTVKMDIPGMPFAMPPQSFQHCLTQADVDSGKQYENQQNKDCAVKNLKQSAGKATFDLACKDGTTGTAEYALTGDGMSGKTVMSKDGHPMTLNMSARRAGDCKK